MGSVEGLLNFGVILRFVAIGTYAAAFVSYAARLAIQRLKLDRAATALASLGVITHTAYLVTRWIAAGRSTYFCPTCQCGTTSLGPPPQNG